MKSLQSNMKKPSQAVETVDLDVTPIMNMFIILIPFLVSMAVFAHYAVLEFSLPPNAGVGRGGPGKKDLKLTVVMTNTSFDLTLGDTVMNSVAIELENGMKPLERALMEIRHSIKRKNEIVVAVNDGILFDKVVGVMDVCRKTGFDKVALAEGPNMPETKSPPLKRLVSNQEG